MLCIFLPTKENPTKKQLSPEPLWLHRVYPTEPTGRCCFSVRNRAQALGGIDTGFDRCHPYSRSGRWFRRRSVPAIAWFWAYREWPEHLLFLGIMRDRAFPSAKPTNGGALSRTRQRPHTAHGAEVYYGFVCTHNDRPEYRCPRPSHARKCCRCCCQGHGFLASLSYCADSSCTAY